MFRNRNKTGFIWALGFLTVFTGLMVFGLKQNATFTPSALVGKPVPFFEAQLYPIGRYDSQTLSQKSSWTIVNFWASTCYVCTLEAKEMQNFYVNVSLINENTPKFLSINIQEDVETIRNWQGIYGQTFPVVRDMDGHISILFGVTGTPETFLIDPKGVIRYRIAGEVNTNFLLNFIEWFGANPTADESEAHQHFIESFKS